MTKKQEQAIEVLNDLQSYDHDKIQDLYQNKPKSLTDALNMAIQALGSISDGMIIYASEGCEGVQIHVLKDNTVTIFAGYIDRQMEYSEWVLRKYGERMTQDREGDSE